MEILNSVSLLDVQMELYKRGCYDLLTINQKTNQKHVKLEQALNCLHDDKIRDVGFGGGAGGGKSFAGGYWLTMMSLRYPQTHWFIARKRLQDLRGTVTNTLLKLWKILGVETPHYNGIDHYWQFPNGSKIFYMMADFEPSDPMFERFSSWEFTGGWFEEASQLTSTAIEILKSRAGRQNNEEYNLKTKFLYTFNPSKGYVYREFYEPYRDKKLPDNKVFIPSLASDNPFIYKDYIKDLKETFKNNQAMLERLLHGNFDFDDDPNKIIDWSAINNIFTNNYVDDGKKYITFDPAGQGKDTTSIFVWSGWRLIYSYIEAKTNQDDLFHKLEDLREKYQVPISNTLGDYTGIGAGVIDRGQYRIFQAGAKPIETDDYEDTKYREESFVLPYLNLRTQCWFHVANIINDNLVFVDLNGFDLRSDITKDDFRKRLVEELDVIKEVNGTDSKRRIIPKGSSTDPLSKVTIKSLLGRSPDIGDNIMMRAYFDLNDVNILAGW